MASAAAPTLLEDAEPTVVQNAKISMETKMQAPSNKEEAMAQALTRYRRDQVMVVVFLWNVTFLFLSSLF